MTQRVLMVLANGGTGGMQRQVRLQRDALRALGHDVVVAIGDEHADDVVTLPPFSRRWPFPFMRALRREVRRLDVDVVHGHGLRLAPFIAHAGANVRVVTCHGIDPDRAPTTIRAVRHERVRFVSCGEGPRSVLAASGLESRIINNVLAPTNTAHTRDELRAKFELADVPIALLPARFSPQKNHALLVSALRAVRSRMGVSAPEFVFVGNGPLFNEISRDVALDGQRPLAHCFSHLDDASSWMSATDFFVLPSTWEGQPMVVLEALRAGLSVLTSTPSGIEDLVFDGRNGRRVEGANGLANVVIEWSSSPESRPRDDAFTSDLLTRHEPEVVAHSLEALYQLP